MGHHDQLAGMVQSIENFCRRVQQGLNEATFEQKRQLIELLVDRVVVTGEEVEIRYVIPLSPKSEPIRFCHLRLDYFHGPMVADQAKKLLDRTLFAGQAGPSIDDFNATLFWRFAFALQTEDLPNLYLEIISGHITDQYVGHAADCPKV